jgi:hypothetical protein
MMRPLYVVSTLLYLGPHPWLSSHLCFYLLHFLLCCQSWFSSGTICSSIPPHDHVGPPQKSSQVCVCLLRTVFKNGILTLSPLDPSRRRDTKPIRSTSPVAATGLHPVAYISPVRRLGPCAVSKRLNIN